MTSKQPREIVIGGNQKAPEPMERLTREVIHPDNVTREAAVMRALMTKPGELKKLKNQREQMYRGLVRAGFYALIEQRNLAIQRMKLYRDEYVELQSEQPEGYQERTVELTALARDVKQQISEITSKLALHKKQYITLKRCEQTIEVYAEAIERKRHREERFRLIDQEAQSYAEMIRDRWKSLAKCHHIKYVKGQAYYYVPRIEEIHITDNTIYYKIFTTYKTWFGWRNMLPYDVYVQDLLSPETLFELEAITGRTIEAVYPEKGNEAKGYWLKLHRTDTPNGILDHVDYSEVMRFYPDIERERCFIPVGVGEHNKIKWINFTDYPHWLVAGFTGSGKSNLLNVFISCLITTNSPAQLRMVMVDLKGGVELDHYAGIPHLLGDVVTSVEELADRLEQLEAEMSLRFAALKRYGARDLITYNKRSDDYKPRLIVVIDEFASTVDQGDLTKRIHNSILQLTSKGRAVGIHVLLCTQDPRVETIPGKIKSNCTVRVAGRTATTDTSRIILGSGEAAKIADVKGRMLLKLGQLPVEVQTPYINDHDMREAIKAAMSYGPANEVSLPVEIRTERWTAEKIIELSLTHLGGNISARSIWDEIRESGMSLGQTRKIVEAIWARDTITHNDVTYTIKKKATARYLIPEGKEDV
jgi:hypothetical protein